MKAKTKTPKTLSDLIADDANANAGTVRGHEVVQESLKRYGAGRSILIDKAGRVIAGNKTLSEAAAAGLDEEIVVVQTTGNQLVVVQRTDLDLKKDAKAKGLAVADNRTSELGLEWNPTVLSGFNDLDLKPFFTDAELAKMTFADTNEPASTSREIDVDAMKMQCRCPKCGFQFDPK